MNIATRTFLLSAVLGLWACWAGQGLCADRPASRDPQTVAAAIDRAIDACLAKEKIPASGQASDAEFLRRASLDLVGHIPTARRVSAFLADRRPDRRRRLIDELLAEADYGRNFGTIWYHLLIAPTDDNRRAIDPVFGDWLAKQFTRNRGWDQIVTDILTVQGKVDAQPATVFWFAHVEGGKAAKLNPAAALRVASQRFLGTRYQCAECHNHPFARFKRTDFWSLAAFFGKTEARGASRKAVKRGSSPAIHDLPAGTGIITIPDSKGKTAAPAFPGEKPYRPDGTNLRTAFARWATAPSNPAFARAAVNRMWGHLLGRGLIDPVDDFREDNEPTHPELLDMLAQEFVSSGHDLKHLIRCICNSRAYQRSSDAKPGNATDEKLCSHAAIKLLSTDALVRSLSLALGRENDKRGGKARKEEAKLVTLFDTSEERDFSREYSHGIPQVLRLMNGIDLEKVPVLRRTADSPAKVIESLYLATLSRPPTEAEAKRASAHVARASSRSRGYTDLLWALLNSGEFVFNH